MIHILVDSAADFSKKEIEEKGIHLVPLQVNFQEEQYLDKIFRRLHSHLRRNFWMYLRK